MTKIFVVKSIDKFVWLQDGNENKVFADNNYDNDLPNLPKSFIDFYKNSNGSIKEVGVVFRKKDINSEDFVPFINSENEITISILKMQQTAKEWIKSNGYKYTNINGNDVNIQASKMVEDYHNYCIDNMSIESVEFAEWIRSRLEFRDGDCWYYSLGEPSRRFSDLNLCDAYKTFKIENQKL